MQVRIATRAIGWLVIVVATMALAEVLVRATGVAPQVAVIELDTAWGAFVSSPNRALRYVPNPGHHDINASGYRDRERSATKPPGVVRVVVIGDSVAYGYCDPGQEPFPIGERFTEVASRELGCVTGAPCTVDIVNLGVSGYDTEQEVAFFVEKGLRLGPDVVVVAFSLNDFGEAAREIESFREQQGWPLLRRYSRPVVRAAIDRSALVRLLAARLPFVEHGDPRPELGFDRLHALAAEHGFRVVVAVFPRFDVHGTDALSARHHDLALQLARDRGFDTLDLRPHFAASPAGLTSECGPEHPDRRGHELAGRVLAAQLAKYLPAHSGGEAAIAGARLVHPPAGEDPR